MSSSVSLPTIKILFAQASVCAYPGCDTSLVFEERNRRTVIADIAHIRSESVNGPRYDPNYGGDFSAPENLLLLCGIHHRPVDRHESVYRVEELERWKRAQVSDLSRAPLAAPESELRRLVAIGPEERATLARAARFADRLHRQCAELTRALSIKTSGIQGHGSWRKIVDEETLKARPELLSHFYNLTGELAAVRMMIPRLGQQLDHVELCASKLLSSVDSSADFDEWLRELEASITSLWDSATSAD